ncbi:hypothetical protein SAMN05421546_2119 [Solilutibacter tolerans]|uniref:Phytoene/squalene synthetase n=1 Tax=Solilutibacter tolerans TaxID=1604334 RepID=A0A1N6X2U2_9GAMM|nr:hypothetical protein SAMN05421546_2119 [Lysobacter tolerans]
MAVNEAAAEAASFVEKWRTRWPEWGIARVFVRADQRELAEHWFALLQEWTDAASTTEPAPGLAKLAWWQEELRGWAKGARRHPLGARLQKQPVDWNAVADALPALAHRGEQLDAPALSRLAQALSDAEQRLFDEQRDGKSSIDHLLGEALGRIQKPDEASGGTRPRRILSALALKRAQTGQSPVPPLGTLRCSWRAARAHGPG